MCDSLFIRCEVTGGGPVAGLETSGVGFFAEEALPELSRSRVTLAQIRHLFEHARHPHWPTDLD